MDPYPTAALLVVAGHLIVAGLRSRWGTDPWLLAATRVSMERGVNPYPTALLVVAGHLIVAG